MFYYVFKDGAQIGRTCSKKEAVEMIRAHQQHETHYLLRASFSIIKTDAAEEFISYPKTKRGGAKR